MRYIHAGLERSNTTVSGTEFNSMACQICITKGAFSHNYQKTGEKLEVLAVVVG
jgi:hypothetical protein